MNNPYSAPDGTEQLAGQIRPSVRTVQIISFALIQGVLLFGCVAVFLRGGRLNGEPSIVTWIAVGMSGLMLLNHFIIPRILARGMLTHFASSVSDQTTDAETEKHILGVFQAQHIVGYALLEGAAFFALIAYLTDTNPIAIGSALVMVILMVLRFPTASRVQFWVEDRIRELKLSGH